MQSALALQNFDINEAIDRIASGTLTKQIAEELGLKKPTLRDALRKHPAYDDAIKSQAESLVEKATSEAFDDELEADNAVISRARLRLDAAHKWAAARDPATWSARPEFAGAKVTINVVQYVASAPQTQGETIEHNHLYPDIDRSNVATSQHKVGPAALAAALESRFFASIAGDQQQGVNTPNRSPVAPRLADSGDAVDRKAAPAV